MEGFVPFSREHILSIVAYTVLLIISIFLTKKVKDKRRLAKFIGWFFIFEKLAELAYRHYYWGDEWINLLPLHLCNINHFLICIMLITGSYFLFEITYFWLSGAIIAIAIPELSVSFPDFANISFFITHFFLIYAPVFAIMFFGFRPTLSSYFKSFIGVVVTMVIVYIININIGTNYMFLVRKPSVSSPLDSMGPWPIYLVALLIFSAVLFFIMYLPFRKKKVKYK